MWTRISHIIIKNRLFLIICLAVITAFMAFKAQDIQMTFKFAELVPKQHQEMKYFDVFRQQFGEDANVMVIGFSDSSIFEMKKFERYQQLCMEISAIPGVDSSGVVALPTLPYLHGKGRNRSRRFKVEKLFANDFFTDSSTSEQEKLQLFEEKLAITKKLQFYEGLIYNSETGATLMMVPISADYINSKKRIALTGQIESLTQKFSKETNIKIHYAGLPFIRSVLTGEVQRETKLFLWLSLGITAVILLFFFRSLIAVIFPLIVIGVAVAWTMGTIVLFGFKVNMITGLIPPIIVVIGIPNCVYLLNKYHQEFDRTKNKIKALSKVVRKIGIVTLITNCTTAVGFLVLISADITILREFGIVAGLNVLATFLISVILIPAVFSYLPNPTSRQLRHLDSKVLEKLLQWLDHVVINHRRTIYLSTIVVVLITLWGSWKIFAVSYMVDDIPEESRVKRDLHWFESNFKGVMPLEIVINTEEEEAFRNLEILRKVDQFESYLMQQPEISKSISIVQLVKAINQSMYYDNTDFYALPTENDKVLFGRYLKNSTRNQKDLSVFDSKLVDSTGHIRLSLKVADIGSKRMDALIHQRIAPVADSIFGAELTYNEYENYAEAPYRITGTTLLFIKGNQFLLWNLRQSLIIAIVLIALIMALLFRSFKMIVLSLITNLIPLAITGALMGFFEIPLKPSTALIFSIAFGISVDDSIHFLAKYRQELFASRFSVSKAVSVSIRETGSSMIYTSIVLFAGFIIFAGSNFLGTVMLGVLTSCTLLFAMFTNLIVLPSLLLTFDSGKRKGRKRLIDSYREATIYEEEENEEIDYDKIELESNQKLASKSEI